MNPQNMLLFSLIGVVLLVLLVRMFGFARQPGMVNAGLAARLAADAVPGFQPNDAIASRDGAGGLVCGRDGSVVLVRALGDRHVVRPLHSPLVARAGAVLRVRPDEPMFPETALDLGEADATLWAARL